MMFSNSSTFEGLDNSTTLVEPWAQFSVSGPDQWLAILFGIVLAICGFVTFFTNVFLLALIIVNRSLWKIDTLLVLNVVLPNVICPPFVHLFSVISSFSFHWIFSYDVCLTVGFFTSIYRLNSWTSLSLLSLQRLFSVVFPFRYTNHRHLFVISSLVTSWSVILALSVPPVVLRTIGFDLILITCVPTSCKDWGESHPLSLCIFFAVVVQCLSDVIAFVPLAIYLKMTRIAQLKMKHIDGVNISMRTVMRNTNGINSEINRSTGLDDRVVLASCESGENCRSSNASGQRCLPMSSSSTVNIDVDNRESSNLLSTGNELNRQNPLYIKKQIKITQKFMGFLIALVSTFAPGSLLRLFLVAFSLRRITSFSLTYLVGGYIAVAFFPAFILSDREFRMAAKKLLCKVNNWT